MITKTLATIGKIAETKPIPEADLIIQATVVCGSHGKWQGVVANSMAVGEKVTVFLQDAILQEDPRWAFMARHKWRVRMAKFRGVPSECLIVPATHDLDVGSDVTELLGVTKYSKPVPPNIAGDQAGLFPSYLPKTDEPNFQKVDWQQLMQEPFYVTEKADGSSCTAWVLEDGLHVASRNFELREISATGAGNVFWQVARKYALESMPTGTAVQFEVIGPKIQSNPHGLSEVDGRLFGHFRCVDGRWERQSIAEAPTKLPRARLIHLPEVPKTAEELRTLAEIRYANGKHGEGVVIRANDQSWSFKVINLNYKD